MARIKKESLPVPVAMPPREYRALEVFKDLPPGCALFPVMDERSDPHLRLGEIAVVDTTDRAPQHGEVYVIEWSSGRRVITQLLAREMYDPAGDYIGWWTSPLTAREYIRGMGETRMIDGPRKVDGMRQALLGRVVGIFESLPIERRA